jgi:hypothetical protein
MDKYEKEIIRFTKELRIKMLEKYRKGKIEHGGEPSAIDPQKENSRRSIGYFKLSSHCEG